MFVAQNYGAKKTERINKGIKRAIVSIVIFCAIVSSIVFIFQRIL